MPSLPELHEQKGRLTFVAVERRLSPEDEPTSLGVMGAAAIDGEPVGLAFELAFLDGLRVVHPLRVSSIGAPTEAVIAACGGKAATPTPFAVEGFATAEWREVSAGNGSLMFKPKDLTWERARFKVTLNAGKKTCHGELELDLDAGRFVFTFEKERDFAKVLEAGRAGETS